MDPETKELLKESIELGKQNNAMLAKLIRAHKLATIYRIVYWSIIILSTFGAYYFIQPYLTNLLNVYTGATSADGTGQTSFSDVFKKLQDKNQMQDLINTIKN